MTYTPKTIWIGGPPTPAKPKHWRNQWGHTTERNAFVTILRNDGLTLRAIAEKTGLSIGNCSKILKRHSGVTA